ncbi:hypothetical protein RB653_006304 [Dictyostelium firmibasis]|uniref:Profilin n=1 Tax=Dictyostelium firmibasis TaxID=79012 RepID=A0AAN7UMG2_9MYCE
MPIFSSLKKIDFNNNNNNNNINNINNNMINNNIENNKIKNWKIFSDRLINEGFSMSSVVDIESGEASSGFSIGYHEWQEILKLLSGKHTISINLLSKRYFIVNSSEFFVSGHANTSSFLLRRTNNKMIIGTFEFGKLTMDKAHQIINDIYTQITNSDKGEVVSNLFI